MPVLAVRKRIPRIHPWEVVILLAIMVLLFTLCLVHAGQDLTPPANDEAWYLAESFKLYSSLCRSGLKHFFWPLLYATPDKPPMITLLPLLVYPFRGETDIFTAKFVLAFSLSLIVLFTFLLARPHIRAPGAFIAAMLAASTPMTIVLSQKYYAEVPTTACLLAFVYLINKSDLLRKRPETVYAGLCFGIGVLLKIFFFFMGGAILILVLVQRFREEPELRKPPGVVLFGCALAMFIVLGISIIAGASSNALKIILFCTLLSVGILGYFGRPPWRYFLATAGPGAALAAIIAAPWYLTNGHRAWQYFVRYALGPQVPTDPFNVPPIPIWRFAQVLINDTFGLFIILLGIGFGIWGIARRRTIRLHLPPIGFWLLLAVWGALPILVFAVPSRRVARVLLPVVPAFAIGVGVLISAIFASRDERFSRVIAVSIGILALANILYVSFGPRGGGLTVGPFYIVRDPNPPSDKKWSQDRIHHLIREKHKGLRQVLVIFHTPTMNRNVLYCAGSMWRYRQFVYRGYHDWRTRGYLFPGEKPPGSGKASKRRPIPLAGMFIVDERVKGEKEDELPAGVAEFRTRLMTAVKAGHAKELSSKPYNEPNGSIIHVWVITK